MMRCVAIEHISVRPSRIVVDVRMGDESCAYTNQQVIRMALQSYPHLLEHACVNERGRSFAAVAMRTSSAHLLEHMVIERQARAARRADTTFVGKTTWLDRRNFLARVELSYEDDLDALAALQAAARDLDAILCAARRSAVKQP